MSLNNGGKRKDHPPRQKKHRDLIKVKISVSITITRESLQLFPRTNCSIFSYSVSLCMHETEKLKRLSSSSYSVVSLPREGVASDLVQR